MGEHLSFFLARADNRLTPFPPHLQRGFQRGHNLQQTKCLPFHENACYGKPETTALFLTFPSRTAM
jgi:hypothetical protein